MAPDRINLVHNQTIESRYVRIRAESVRPSRRRQGCSAPLRALRRLSALWRVGRGYQRTGPERSMNRPVPASELSVARVTIASVPSVTVW